MPTEILSLEVKEDGTRVVRRSIESLGTTSDKADKAVVGLQRDLRNFTQQINPINQLKRALGGVGAALALGSAFNQALQFGDAMNEVSTLVDETTFNMNALTEAAKEQAVQFGSQPVNQSKALYQIISAGAQDSASAIDTLTAANKLAVGGVTDVAIAADGLTTILNAYGEKAGTASEVSDTLFVGMRAGKTTIEQLSSSLGKVVPLAESLDVSFEELVAATSALTKGGISTTESVTGLRAVLSAIAKPTKEASTLANSLGLEFNLAGIQSLGFAGFIDELAEKTNGSKQALTQLFGGVEALVPIMALSGKAGESFNEIMEDMTDKVGETDEAFDKITEGPGFKFRQLMALMNTVLINVGDVLATVLSPIMSVLVTRFEDVTVAAAAFFSVLAIGKISAISSAITVLTLNIKAMTVAIAANPLGLLAVAISTVVAGLAFFRNEIKLSSQSLATLNDFLSVSFDVFVDFASGAISAFNSLLDYLDETFLINFRSAFDGLMNVTFADFLRGTGFFIDTVIGAFRGLGNAIGVAVASGVIRIRNSIRNELNEILRNVERNTNEIINTTNRVFGSTFENVNFDIPADLTDAAESFGKEVGDAFSKGAKVTFAQDVINSAIIKAEERAAIRDIQQSVSGGTGLQRPESISVDLPGAQGGSDNINISAGLKDINEQLEIERDLLIETSPAARGLKSELLSISRELESKNIFLSEQELAAAFEGTLKLNQQLRDRAVILDQISGPQEEFTRQIEAIQNLVQSGEITGGQSASSIIDSSSLLDFQGTQTQLDSFVEQHRNAFAQIDELQQARLISDQTANQLRLRADTEYMSSRLSVFQEGFGALATLSSSENKRLSGIGKAAAIANATIDTYKAATGAYASLASIPFIGPALGAAAAAAAITAGLANVSVIKSQSVQGRRLGGDVSAGQLFRVGEGTRPEAFTNSLTGERFFIPPERGRVEPLRDAGQGRSSSQSTQIINNNISVQGSGNAAQDNNLANKSANQIGRQMTKVLAASQRGS